MQIVEWKALESLHSDALVLGNGASIAIDDVFGYSALLDSARESGRISPELENVFTYVGAPDFELVLTMLWHAQHVNNALKVGESSTINAYISLRDALIHTVQSHHASYDSVCEKLGAAADFMQRFRTVASLNYDLLVYWASLVGNERLGKWFKDAFLNDRFLHDWSCLRNQYGKATGATMVFYPHGNLVLATDLRGEEVKIKVPTRPFVMGITLVESDLLTEVTKRWTDGGVTPLFVSEGVSAQKFAAINRSAYLRNVYETVLPSLGEGVCIYGWSAADNDQHILAQLLRGSRKLAFSVTRRGGAVAAASRCSALLGRVRSTQNGLKIRNSPEIQFFWADSAGAWVNPAA